MFLHFLAATIGLFSSIIPAPVSIQQTAGTYNHASGQRIECTFDPSIAEEGYRLAIDSTGVSIACSADAGRYYALVSLSQMTGLPTDSLECSNWQAECGLIDDAPRFQWRGLLVDVSRHFRSLEFLYRHVDAMAACKLNVMHMHLTDAGGWRIEIDRYPVLTDYTAWRTGERYMQWWRHGNRRYGGEFGGYYTKEQMRELIAYAAKRNVTIVPEIELPGHNDETTVAYPWLSCDEGKSGEVCPGKETTFEFFENVLDEVMELFPSHYIHIGGDEASRAHWKKCLDCKRRMEQEGLGSYDELQSYMIRRIDAFVRSRGREIVGWDEILDGGLASGALVMSWRGTAGGAKAAAAGHGVIMTPGEWCYIDTAQDYPEKEPWAYGNYLPSWKVYEYDPRAGVKGAEYVIGVQANLWAECVETDSMAEYMYWPRSLALAEVGWSPVERKNWKDFRRRAIAVSDRMRAEGYNVFDLKTEYGQRPEALVPQEHMAKGVVPQLQGRCKWSSGYPAGGTGALTDGKCGGWTYKDGRWQGYLCDFDAILDLGEMKPVHFISMMSMQNEIPGVFLPKCAIYSISDDGSNWTVLGQIDNDVPAEAEGIYFRTFEWKGEAEGRYLRIEMPRGPKGAFLFLDEIIVR